MLGISISEWLGYLASAFVAVSLLMSNMSKLRWINLVGCVLFVAYGLWITAYPVVIMNFFGALVNIYHLWQLYSKNGQTN